MKKFDANLTSEERTGVLEAFNMAQEEGSPDLAQRMEAIRSRFDWDKTDDFYLGYSKGLLHVLDVLDSIGGEDFSTFKFMLLMQVGIVLKHLERG